MLVYINNWYILINKSHTCMNAPTTVEYCSIGILSVTNLPPHYSSPILCDMFLCSEGLVNRHEAVLMVEPRHLDQLLHPTFRFD